MGTLMGAGYAAWGSGGFQYLTRASCLASKRPLADLTSMRWALGHAAAGCILCRRAVAVVHTCRQGCIAELPVVPLSCVVLLQVLSTRARKEVALADVKVQVRSQPHHNAPSRAAHHQCVVFAACGSVYYGCIAN